MARIVSLNVSTKKGTGKKPVERVTLVPDYGIENDGHAGKWHRQISLLAMESINKMNDLGHDFTPGVFAENLTTEGLVLTALPVGTRLVAGEVELEITQIGKKCHAECEIHKLAGDCIMPKEGVFARVIKGGVLYRNAGLELKKD